MASEQEPGGHAVLAPSAAERWIACPASVRMARQVVQPPPASTYANEGTAAHALAELTARYVLLENDGRAYKSAVRVWEKEHGEDVTDREEMQEHVTGYVELLRERRDEHPNSQLLLEQRVPTGVPSCWGTADAVIVSPVHVEVVDLKYGMGVQVVAENNPQLRLYGVGALEAFGDLLGETHKVRMTVHQPRLHHTVSEDLAAVELRAWRDSLIPVAEQALGPDAPFGPSEAACRWCPASGQCKAQLEYATMLDFGTDPDALDTAELAAALDQIPAIMAWCQAVRDYALDRVYSQGQEIPGYKVVLSGGRRVIKDEAAALEALTAVGYTLDQVSRRKINGIGDLEKLLKKDFDTVLGTVVTRTEGAPALVPETDKRASATPNAEAAKVFAP